MHALDPGPGTQGAIGQEIIAGDDRIGQLDRLGETPEATAAVRPTRIVRIAIEDGVVEIEDEVANGAAQDAELPCRQEFALQDHGVEPLRAAELEDRANVPLSSPSQVRDQPASWSAGAKARMR